MTTIVNTAGAAPPGLVPIRPFSDLSTADLPYAGRKGAGLGELTRTGLAVPPGFVVGAPALRAAAEDAREAQPDSDMPDWLVEAIGAAYEALCQDATDAPVAVRASAIVEDTGSASFAGMNETFLNVRDRGAVIEAVKRCWRSPFGAGMDIAVVVQRQIASTRAGVMFTIDPATGERDRLAIEGSFGLGESMVSGQVSRDRYVVEKSSMAVVARSVRPKELTIEASPGGGTTTRLLDAEESVQAVLTDEEVLRLAELGIAIERECGTPQDIEWAFDPEGNIWLLRSRPATA
jgi:pyruvate,water dikinase